MGLRRPLHPRVVHRGEAPAEHVGVLVPWANTAVETELPLWGRGQIVWHYARLVPPGGGTALTDDFLSGLVTAMPGALHQLSVLPLARAYLACTSAAFTQQQAVKEAAASAAVPVVTAFDAIQDALARLGARSIVLATPYPSRITAIEAEAFEGAGFTVTATASLDLADGYARVTSGQLGELLFGSSRRDLAQAEAIVLSCTGWPTHTALGRLRHRLGCPLISSNLAICMHALRTPP